MNDLLIGAANDLAKRERPEIVAATGLFFVALRSFANESPLKGTLLSYRGGIWGDEAPEGQGYPVLRSTNMRGARANVTDAAWRIIRDTQAQDYALETGDILVTKSSGSSDLVGKATLFINPHDGKTYLFSNFTMRLRPNTKLVLPEFVAWFLRSPQSLLWRYESQQNAVGLRNLQTTEFLGQGIPVPPLDIQKNVVKYLNLLEAKSPSTAAVPLASCLDEQRRIVARIEQLAAKIQEARYTQIDVVERCDALCRSMIFGNSSDVPVPTEMGTIVKLREPDVEVRREGIYSFAGVYCFGKGVFSGTTKSGMEFEYSRLTRLRVGDFVYPKLMAWEGALGVVPPDCDGRVVSPEFPVFEIDQSQVLPETLDVYFRSPSVWPLLAEISTGTNVRRRRLHPSAFLKFKMPLPKMDTQVKLREVKKRVDGLKTLQSETAAELDALMPSILDKAFRGEL
jgi:hypothetical protein